MHISYGCLTLNLLCYVICSRPPQVDVHHGNCTLPDRGVATGAASSVAGKTNAGVAVSVAQSADVCPGGGGGDPCVCVAVPFAWLSSPLPGSRSSPRLSSAISWACSALRCVAVFSQISVLIFRAFMSRLQTSLYLCWGRPWSFLPKASWP